MTSSPALRRLSSEYRRRYFCAIRRMVDLCSPPILHLLGNARVLQKGLAHRGHTEANYFCRALSVIGFELFLETKTIKSVGLNCPRVEFHLAESKKPTTAALRSFVHCSFLGLVKSDSTDKYLHSASWISSSIRFVHRRSRQTRLASKCRRSSAERNFSKPQI